MEKFLLAFVGCLVGFGISLLTDPREKTDLKGALVAFEKECPSGWEEYKQARGRFLLAAGQGNGLMPRDIGQIGGVDEVGYQQEYQSISTNSVSGSDGVVVPKELETRRSFVTTRVEMPPFLVVKLCSYNQVNDM